MYDLPAKNIVKHGVTTISFLNDIHPNFLNALFLRPAESIHSLIPKQIPHNLLYHKSWHQFLH